MKFRTERWLSARALICGLAIIVGLQVGCTRDSSNNNSNTNETPAPGVITLLSGTNGEVCPHPVANLNLSIDRLGCGLHNLQFIHFGTVRSGTSVKFIGYANTSGCNEGPVDWAVEIKTRATYNGDREHPLEIDQILKGAQPGKVVDKNLQVSDMVLPGKGPDFWYMRHLDCIQIRDGTDDVKSSQAITVTDPGNKPQISAPHPTKSPQPPAPAPASSKPRSSYGYIKLTDAKGADCFLPISRDNIAKPLWASQIPGCYFERFVKMQLEDVPSAVTINLRSFGYRDEGPDYGAEMPEEPSNDCSGSGWGYAFRADIKTMGAIRGLSAKFDVDDIMSTPIDGAVVANVRVLKYSTEIYQYHWPTTYYFSCFKFDLGDS